MRALVTCFLLPLWLIAAVRTGPEMGAKLPNFQAVDQDGKPHRFYDLAGPKGSVLVIYRSADW